MKAIQGISKVSIMLIIMASLVLIVAILLYARMDSGTTQPIAFNHKLHITDVGLECIHCHTGVDSSFFATLPKAAICLECHSQAISDNPEEAKVRKYGGAKGEIPWHRLTRQPNHVFFSHQRHVKLAKISCEKCHGKMETRTVPPPRAPIDLSMNDCIECHRKQGATEDCVQCHR